MDFEYIDESKRSSLPDSEFGVPEQRKFPLDTKEHVLSAIRFFNYVEPKYEKELANNIIRKIHEYKMESEVHPGEKNRFSKYWKDSSNESAIINPKEFFVNNGIGNAQNPALGSGNTITADGNLNDEYDQLPKDDKVIESAIF